MKDLRSKNYSTVHQINERIGQFREFGSMPVTNKEKSRAMKKLMERIVYDRDQKWVELTICYKQQVFILKI